MRILFFSHYFPPEGNAPASRTFENCRRWVGDGHQVTVVTCVPNSPNGVVYSGYTNKLWQWEKVAGIEVCRVWTYLAANKGTVRRTANFLSFLLSAVFFSLRFPKPDIIIATSPQFFCGWTGLIVSRLKRRPFVLEIRDIWPETISTIGAMKNRRMLSLLAMLERWMYRGATHVVTVGEGYRQKLLEREVPADKVSIVTNGADVEFFRPSPPDEDLRQHHKLDGKFICASIGTLGLCSGLQVVPEAARILQDRQRHDIAFLLVGDGAIRDELEQISHSLRLQNLVLAGRQDKQDVPAYISISDVCLAHLQRRELFRTVIPSKIFEAMSMAKPLLLGVEGFAADLVQGAGAGVCIEPENPLALADAVEHLADHPELSKEYGAAGQAFVRVHFNWDNLARQYLEIVGHTLATWNKSRRGASRALRTH